LPKWGIYLTKHSLSDLVENKFAQLGHQNDVTVWELGWFTEWTFDHCTRTDEDGKKIYVDEDENVIKSYELYNLCAEATQVTSVHSLRNWHGVAKNVSPKLKEDYPLGLSHWKAIIPHCNTEKELRKLADIVLSFTSPDGAIISVVDLRRRLSGKDGGPADWEKKLKTATNATKKLANDMQAPSFVRSAARGFLTSTTHPPLP